MSERYTIRVTKDHLVFCAGHFITYNGDDCERLHGHNYRVAVELDGVLDCNYYVFDFVALKQMTKEVTDELDHYMMVAMKNPLLTVILSGDRVSVRYQAKEWIFPREDCVLLPIENTTAELLARYIARKLADLLNNRYGMVPEAIRVEVEESFGQSAKYELQLGVPH